VLFVGRLEEEKGPLEAVAVMSRLRLAGRGAHGAIIGTGRLDAQVRAVASPAGVEVLGSVDDQALALEYARAAVVIVTSRYEGLGLVALEAMAAGAAVVGFDVTGLRDAVGDRGVLVPPGDVEAMVDACAGLLDAPDRRAELAARAREHVRREHSWDEVGARVESVYSSVASSRRG